MQLQELFDYKNTLMEDLLKNQRIVDLLADFVPVLNPEDLAYKQVFPCEYIPETVQDAKTFICFDVDVQESFNKTFLLPTLSVWVFTHRSKLRLPEGGIRTDALCSEICKQINGSRKYGLGELNLYSLKRFAPMTDYPGKVMVFRAVEFNKLHDGNKYTPSNRRFG